MGWTEPRGTRWRGVYRHPDGRRPKATFEYEWQAQEWADTEEAKAYGQPDPTRLDAGMTLGAYADRWLSRRTSIEGSSRRAYAKNVGVIRRSPIGDKPLPELVADDIERWFASMDQGGPLEVSATLWNERLKYLRMILKQAITDGLLVAPQGGGALDPSARIRRRTLPLQEDFGFLSGEEVEALLVAADAPEWRIDVRRVMFGEGELALAILLGADAGLRWCEIGALSIRSVVTRPTPRGPRMFLRIWRALAGTGGKIKPNPKGGEERYVPVTPRLQEAIERRVRRARLAHGPDALLISRADGSPIRYNWSRDHLAAAADQAGVVFPLDGWHDLRHRYGSRLAELGRPTQVIADLMGHSEVDVTRLYMHRSALGVLDAMVDGVALSA